MNKGSDEISRKNREWYIGAKYHVMARGIRRQRIFMEELDFQVFLLLLKRVAEKYELTIHAYCLMPNHFHLLVETDSIELGKAMSVLMGDYAKGFNRRNGYCGHLFESRYKAKLVETDTYFLQTSRYIHLNPVKPKLVLRAEDYRWSSYATIIGLQDDRLTEKEKTLNYFKDKSIHRYRDFVEDTGKKYVISEYEIKKEIEEDELWLPW